MLKALITLSYVLIGLGFGAMGVPLALGRIPPNGTYGFRTARTLSSPEIWYAANRVQGIDLCIGGVAIAVLVVALYLAWRSAPPATLAAINTGIMLAVLIVVAVHGFIAVGGM
jgi:SdpI/YhfL family protein